MIFQDTKFENGSLEKYTVNEYSWHFDLENFHRLEKYLFCVKIG